MPSRTPVGGVRIGLTRHVHDVEAIVIAADQDFDVAVLVEIGDRYRAVDFRRQSQHGESGHDRAVQLPGHQCRAGGADEDLLLSVAVDVGDQRRAVARIADDDLREFGLGYRLTLIVEGVNPCERVAVRLGIAVDEYLTASVVVDVCDAQTAGGIESVADPRLPDGAAVDADGLYAVLRAKDQLTLSVAVQIGDGGALAAAAAPSRDQLALVIEKIRVEVADARAISTEGDFDVAVSVEVGCADGCLADIAPLPERRAVALEGMQREGVRRLVVEADNDLAVPVTVQVGQDGIADNAAVPSPQRFGPTIDVIAAFGVPGTDDPVVVARADDLVVAVAVNVADRAEGRVVGEGQQLRPARQGRPVLSPDRQTWVAPGCIPGDGGLDNLVAPISVHVDADRSAVELIVWWIGNRCGGWPRGLTRRRFDGDDLSVGVRDSVAGDSELQFISAGARTGQGQSDEFVRFGRTGAFGGHRPVAAGVGAVFESVAIAVNEQEHVDGLDVRRQRLGLSGRGDLPQRVLSVCCLQSPVGVDAPGPDIAGVGIDGSVVDGVCRILQDRPKFHMGQLRSMGQHESGDGRDIGRRERRSGRGDVLAVEVGRHDIRSGCGDVYPGAERAVIRFGVFAVGRGDGHDVVVRGGVEYLVRGGIAGAGDEQNPLGEGVVDGLLHDRIAGPIRFVDARAETHVHDVGAVGGRIVQAFSHLGRGDIDAHAQRHDAALPVDAADALAVVADRRDDAGHHRFVPFNFIGGACRGNLVVLAFEIPSMHVVDVAVAVVVDAIVGDLAGVQPDIVLQIGVGDVHSRAQHAYHDVTTAGRDIPGIGHLDQLMGVLIGEIRVVRHPAGPIDVVRLGEFHVRIVSKPLADRRNVAVGLEHVKRPSASLATLPSGDEVDRLENVKPVVRPEAPQGGLLRPGSRAACLGRVGFEPDKDLAWDVFQICRQVRARYPDLLIRLGGWQRHHDPKRYDNQDGRRRHSPAPIARLHAYCPFRCFGTVCSA